MTYIKKLPLPLSAVILACAAIGNLLATYTYLAKNIFGCIATVLFILLTIKIIVCWSDVKEELKNPVIASVVPTYSMAMMILSGYLKDFSMEAGLILWWLGLIIHVVLIIFYTKNFIFKFNIKNVFPSTFIVYVGIAAASITAPIFGLSNIGQVIFWFALISFLILLIVIGYRVVFVKEILEQAMPTMVIFAAPAALVLVGYLNSFEQKSIIMVYFLAVFTGILYIIGLIYLLKCLLIKFYPSYAAFTFPMVIGAIALKGTNNLLINAAREIKWLKYIVKFQEIIAVLAVVYVIIRFIIFIFDISIKKSEMKSIES